MRNLITTLGINRVRRKRPRKKCCCFPLKRLFQTRILTCVYLAHELAFTTIRLLEARCLRLRRIFEFMQKGTYTFAVDRGDENTRRSVLNLEMDHKGDDLLTIRVGGNAVMVAEGIMNIPNL